MDKKQMLKQMIDFNKAAFDNTFDAFVTLQDQIERMSTSALDQMPVVTPEAKKAVNEWVNAYKEGRSNFKQHVDGAFEKVDAYFSGSDK